VQQLLWLETLLKLACGASLLLAPITVIKILGLPSSPAGFWPRLVGALLIGIGAAAFLEGASPGSRGLGLAGLVILNLTGAAVIALGALFGGGSPTRRGAFLLWGLVVLLFALALVEIAYA
jgi:hypothetical protein